MQFPRNGPRRSKFYGERPLSTQWERGATRRQDKPQSPFGTFILETLRTCWRGHGRSRRRSNPSPETFPDKTNVHLFPDWEIRQPTKTPEQWFRRVSFLKRLQTGFRCYIGTRSEKSCRYKMRRATLTLKNGNLAKTTLLMSTRRATDAEEMDSAKPT